MPPGSYQNYAARLSLCFLLFKVRVWPRPGPGPRHRRRSNALQITMGHVLVFWGSQLLLVHYFVNSVTRSICFSTNVFLQICVSQKCFLHKYVSQQMCFSKYVCLKTCVSQHNSPRSCEIFQQFLQVHLGQCQSHLFQYFYIFSKSLFQYEASLLCIQNTSLL